MAAGAPVGNHNAAKGKLYENAVKRALARKAGSVEKGLDLIASRLVDDAIDADDPMVAEKARREIADRIDGKSKQQTELSGDLGVSVQWPLNPGKLG